MNVKLDIKKNKQNYKLNTTSSKENKIHTLVSKLLTENHNESKQDHSPKTGSDLLPFKFTFLNF